MNAEQENLRNTLAAQYAITVGSISNAELSFKAGYDYGYNLGSEEYKAKLEESLRELARYRGEAQ